MHIGRTLLTFLVAVSVAMLPVVGAAASAAKSIDMSVSMDMTASENMSVSRDMSDYCPPEAAPGGKATGNGACMAACASSVFSFSSGAFSDLVFPSVGAQILPLLACQNFRVQTASPPFRPPRV